jgi:hypothetical protein
VSDLSTEHRRFDPSSALRAWDSAVGRTTGTIAQMIERSINDQFTGDGYVVVPGIIGSIEINQIVREVEDLARDGAGTRRLLDLAWCSELARRPADDPA